MPDLRLRGGFRYLTLFLITNGTISAAINDITLEIGFQPTWANLKAYQGYFHSNDDTLNKIWYSGAYTLQTNAVPVNYGRQVPFVVDGWANNGTLGPGGKYRRALFFLFGSFPKGLTLPRPKEVIANVPLKRHNYCGRGEERSSCLAW
jgi:hypothetical protein